MGRIVRRMALKRLSATQLRSLVESVIAEAVTPKDIRAGAVIKVRGTKYEIISVSRSAIKVQSLTDGDGRFQTWTPSQFWASAAQGARVVDEGRVPVPKKLEEAPGDEAGLANKIDDAMATVETKLLLLVDLLDEARLSGVSSRAQMLKDEFDGVRDAWLDQWGGGNY